MDGELKIETDESNGTFRLTEKKPDIEDAIRVKNLLYYRKEDQGVETRPEGS